MRWLRRLLFRGFRRVHRLGRWVRHRFTPAGLVLLGSLIGAGALGVDTRQTLAYQAFAFMGALLLLAMLAAVSFRGRFNVQRHLPRFATVDEPLAYELSVTNLGRRAEIGLELQDELQETLPDFDEFRRSGLDDERGRNAFDRRVGYPRWERLIRQLRGADIKRRALPELPPAAERRVRIETLPIRRGFLHFQRVSLSRADPFGLFRGLRRQTLPARLLVLPRRYPVPQLQLPGHRRYQRGGVSLASEVGESEEFMSLREYRPGDPLRHIHWRSWARMDKPIVKEYQDEYFVRHALVLDTFGQAGALFEDAVSVAASFAYAVRSQDTLLELMFAGTDTYTFTGGRGLGGIDQILEILACVQPSEADFSRLSDHVAARAARLGGAICVFLAWDEARQALVRRLLAASLPVTVVVVHDAAPATTPKAGVMAGREQHFHAIARGALRQGLSRLQ